MNELKQALRQAVEALQNAINCSDAKKAEVEAEGGVVYRTDEFQAIYDDCTSAIVAANAALARPEPEPVRNVYLVATGETASGLETYTRHDGVPPPLCDAERLYASAPTQSAELVAVVAERDALRELLAVSEASDAESIRMYRAARDERDQLRAEVERLRAWKHSQMDVEAQWSPQVVADLLGIWPGHSIRACIMPAVQRLIAERDGLMEQVRDEMDANHELRALGGATGDEDMGTFLRRVISERDQLRAEVERLQSALDDARAGEGVAQLAAQRQPLTDEQIEQMWSAAFNDTSGASTVQLLARAVERTHGISAESGAA